MRDDRHGNVLSDDPKDIEGALEWTKEEIEKIKREENDARELTIEMRPYIERAQKRRSERLAGRIVNA